MVLLQERPFLEQKAEKAECSQTYTVIDIASIRNAKENNKQKFIDSSDIIISVSEDLPPVDEVDVTKYKIVNYKQVDDDIVNGK